MSEIPIILDLNIIIAIGVPLSGLVVYLGRHFWKKEKCFITMKNKINELSAHDNASNDTHNGLQEKIDLLEKDTTEMKIYLKLLLDKEGIKY